MKRCSKCGKFKSKDQMANAGPMRARLSYCSLCRKKQKQATRARDPEAFFRYKINELRSGRRHRPSINQDFDLDKEYLLMLYNLQHQTCCYTGVKLDYTRLRSVSIDRLDNSKGYIKGNVMICSFRANQIKNDQTLEEFKLWMPSWYAKALEVLNEIYRKLST